MRGNQERQPRFFHLDSHLANCEFCGLRKIPGKFSHFIHLFGHVFSPESSLQVPKVIERVCYELIINTVFEDGVKMRWLELAGQMASYRNDSRKELSSYPSLDEFHSNVNIVAQNGK